MPLPDALKSGVSLLMWLAALCACAWLLLA